MPTSPVPLVDVWQRVEQKIIDNTYMLARVYVTLKPLHRRRGPSYDPLGNFQDVARLLLLELKAACEAIGARLVIVSVPDGGGEFRRCLAAVGTDYLPLDDAFSKASEAVMFPHDRHWNATGHRIAADAIGTFLVDRGIFASQGAGSK